IDNEVPDIIHTQGLRPDAIAVKYLQNYKVVSTIRNYPPEDYPMKFGRLTGFFMAMIHSKIIKRAYKPIACSNSLKSKLTNRLNLNLDVIQNGVDIVKYHPVSELEKERLRESLGIPLKSKVYISVGS